MLSEEIAKKFAQELKIDQFTVQREYLQLLFLKYFYAQSESASIFFKGGTAIRLLLGSFRFSEDLDFTSLQSKAIIKKIIEKTIKDLSKEGEGIIFKEEKTIAQAYTGRIFQKIAGLNIPLTIRLDFSLREKPFLTEISLLETIFPVGPYPQVAHLKAEELLAEKIRAIATRSRGRDIFDLWFLLSKGVEIDWSLVDRKMLVYQKSFNLKKLVEAIKKAPEMELKNDLTKFLPQSHRSMALQVKDLALKKLNF